MRQPPLKAIEAVITNRVDNRTRRLVGHYRPYFRGYNAAGQETDDAMEAARITLTQRGQRYWEQSGGKRRIPPM
jgi:hypothetical protein